MRQLKWVLIHVALAYLLYAWTMEGVEWAENIYKFVVWLNFIVSIMLIYLKEARERTRKNGRSVHRYISHWYDVLSLTLLVGFGSIFYGVIYLLSTILQIYIFEGDE